MPNIFGLAATEALKLLAAAPPKILVVGVAWGCPKAEAPPNKGVLGLVVLVFPAPPKKPPVLVFGAGPNKPPEALEAGLLRVLVPKIPPVCWVWVLPPKKPPAPSPVLVWLPPMPNPPPGFCW